MLHTRRGGGGTLEILRDFLENLRDFLEILRDFLKVLSGSLKILRDCAKDSKGFPKGSYGFVFNQRKNFFETENYLFKFDYAWITSFIVFFFLHMFDITYFDGRVSLLAWILLAGIRQIIKEKNENLLFK